MKLNKIIILLVLALFLSSCGEQNTSGKRAIASTGESFTSEIKSLSAYETSIALRVCNSFRSKRNYWHMSSIIGKTANISYSERNCNETAVEAENIDTIISASNLSAQIILASLSDTDYKKEIETDLHGHLKQTCPVILSGGTPIEFFQESNERVYLVFDILDESTDRVQLKFTKLNSDSSVYESYRVLSFEVKTSGVEDTLIGSVSSTSDYENCETGSDRYFTQVLNSIL